MTKLPHLKQRIYDVVRRAGPDGISHGDLFAIIYQHHQEPPNRNTLKAHVCQLRKMGRAIRYLRSEGVYQCR